MINVYDEDEYDEFEDEDFDDEFEELGPDEMDQDLMDGTWEQAYYTGQTSHRDWNSIWVGLALLAVAGLVVPMLLVFRP